MLSWLLKMFRKEDSVTKRFNPKRHEGGEGVQSDPLDFLALNFCSLTDYQKLWQHCSLFIKTSFNPR